MKKIIVIKKKEGETPLEALGVFRRKHPLYQSVPLTYAGRLDPMASGLLIVLAGEECKNKEKYLNLDKQYEFEVLFGFSTDTHDILGKVIESADGFFWDKKALMEIVKNKIKQFKGPYEQSYPLYSSKTVLGKQLWQYAREGTEVEPPHKSVQIKKIEVLGMRQISATVLQKNIIKRIHKVHGDFRQAEIIQKWEEVLNNKNSYFIAKCRVECSSGTYVRVIAHALGEKVGAPALAYRIERTRIGKYAKV